MYQTCPPYNHSIWQIVLPKIRAVDKTLVTRQPWWHTVCHVYVWNEAFTVFNFVMQFLSSCILQDLQFYRQAPRREAFATKTFKEFKKQSTHTDTYRYTRVLKGCSKQHHNYWHFPRSLRPLNAHLSHFFVAALTLIAILHSCYTFWTPPYINVQLRQLPRLFNRSRNKSDCEDWYNYK